MDTYVTTTCPRCGRIELDLDDVALVWEPRHDERWFFFDCHGCATRVVKDAPPAVAAVLTLAQVQLIMVPSETTEHRDGGGHLNPALHPDDVLDAVLELRSTDFLAFLAEENRAA